MELLYAWAQCTGLPARDLNTASYIYVGFIGRTLSQQLTHTDNNYISALFIYNRNCQ